MKVCNNDLGTFQVAKHVIRNKFSALVVAVWVVGLKYAKTVSNRDARRDYQKPARELFAIGPTNCVNRLPCYKHGHNSSLACTCGELKSQPHQVRVGLPIGIGQVVEKLSPVLAGFWGHFRQPNGCFDSFYLAEERTNVVELVISPMLE